MSGERGSGGGRRIPSSRLGRLYHMGRATGDLALGVGLRQLIERARDREATGPVQLSPERARRFTERLGQMRGAVMKMGQLMSMDGADLLSPEVADIMGALRKGAEPMPLSQLDSVLKREYGRRWQERFRRFDFTPIAAASIGQVHYAEAPDGRALALKIQFPGVRESIDSDLGNLRFLVRSFGVVPEGVDVEGMLAEAHRELHQEADYAAEADALEAYAEALGEDPDLTVPRVQREFCTPRILAMDYAEGIPIHRLAEEAFSQAERDRAAGLLSRLNLRELFELGLVQTDPNFGNYLYQPESGRIVLLDFGATHTVGGELVAAYRRMGRAARDGDRQGLRESAAALGYIDAGTSEAEVEALLELLEMTSEPLRQAGAYDFGASELFERVYYRGRAMFLDQQFSRAPAPETLFLHRKFMGTFMLCRRLRARVDIAALMAEHLGEGGEASYT